MIPQVTVNPWDGMREKFDAVLAQAFPLPGNFCHCGCDPRHHCIEWRPNGEGVFPSGTRVVYCKEHRKHWNRSGCCELPRLEDFPREVEQACTVSWKRWGERP